MNSTGAKLLGGYWRFVFRYIRIYTIATGVALAVLLVFDAIFPEKRVYNYIVEAVLGSHASIQAP